VNTINLEQLRHEIIDYKVQIEKCTDTSELLLLKRRWLETETKLLNAIEDKSTNTKLFAPKNIRDIKGLNLEVVGLNYIPFIKGAYNILTGRGGSGKSAIALKSMIMYLAINPTKTGLAFFTEDGKDDITSRLEMICRGENIDSNDIINRVHFITVENDDRIKWAKTSRDGYQVENVYINEVIAFAKDNNVGFIIIDPLKRFHSLSENSNDDMDVLVRDVFVDMAVKTEAVLLVLHHSSKSGESGASRGASTISDSARLGWNIGKYYIKNEKTGEVVVDESKRNKIKLSIIKDNQGLEGKCIIRDVSDNSIPNPLSGFIGGYNNKAPEITQYKYKENTNNIIDDAPAIDADIPDLGF